MIKIKINAENVLVSIFFIILIFSGIGFMGWNYDEYGAVVSHLELKDERFIAQYLLILENFGFSKEFSSRFLLPIIYIFIVPIRWTYALGISPLYSIIRIDGLSWSEVKIILIIIHALVACIGIKFITLLKTENRTKANYLILLCSAILLSSPFIYWLGSFTSYSYHIICFSILLLIEFNKENWEKRFIGRLSLSRATIALFNYQYIPILFAAGIFELVKHRANFFKKGLYKAWVLTAFIISISIFFILTRLALINSDIDPALNFPKANSYLIPYGDSFSSILLSLKFFSSRIIDILDYFFLTNSFNEYFRLESFSSLNLIMSLMVMVGILFFSILIFKASKDSKFNYKVIKTSAQIILIQAFLYIFNILPMSPTRHSLIIFLPLASLAIILFIFLIKNFDILKNNLKNLTYFIFLISASSFFYRIDHIENRVISSIATSCVIEERLDKIILEPCFFEPILDNKKQRFIYSCGTFENEIIGDNVNSIVLFSNSILSFQEKKSLISRYSDSSWTEDLKARNNIFECLDRSSIDEDESHVNIDVFKKHKAYEASK